jgi:hypothetical protein
VRLGTGQSGATRISRYCETGRPVLRRTCGLAYKSVLTSQQTGRDNAITIIVRAAQKCQLGLVARHRPGLRPREEAIPPPRYVTRSTANYQRLVIGDQFDGIPALIRY